ncbi:MAG TPA: CobD/CbiB family protein [Rhodocyclaceae bacterium]
MTLLAVIVALALEQFRPLASDRWVNGPLGRLAAWLEDKFNDGQYRHGVVAWVLAVALPAALLQIAYLLLLWLHPVIAAAMALVVLYFNMGFRQFSHHFTDITLALQAGELDKARGLLGRWRGHNADSASAADVVRLSIEQALLASHKHVFAPLFWFALAGPGGAMLYRCAAFFAEAWGGRCDPAIGRFGEFSRRAFAAIDWLPVRLTATGFAVVGDFEDAVYCWRTQASGWSDESSGILLSSGAGAMGVRLGLPVHEGPEIEDRPELGLGDEADVDHLQSTVGLVWRTVVLGLLLLALIWVSGWAG